MSLKKNIVANYFGQGWVALMSLVFIPVYIQYMGIESYGLIGIFAMLQAWLSLLDLGMTPTLSREMAKFSGGGHDAQSIRNLLRSVEIIAILVAIFIATSIGCSANWLALNWLRAEKLPVDVVAGAFSIMGIVTALGFIQGIYVSSIIGFQRQVLLNIVTSIISTLRGLGAVGVLLWISPTIEAFFIWQGIVSVISVVVLSRIVYMQLPKTERSGRFSLKSLSDIWKFASGMMGITFISLVLTQFDKILLSRLLTLEAFGYYTLAFSVANVLMKFVGPIDQAFFPLFTEQVVRKDETSLISSYHKGSQMVTVLMGTATIMLIFYGKTLMLLWTGNMDLVNQTTTLIAVLAFGNLLNGLMHIPYHMQLAHGWTSLTFKMNVIASIILIPAIFFIAPIYGAIGAAWIWVTLNAGYVLIGVNFMYLRILKKEKINWYVRDILLPLVVATIVAGILYYFTPEKLGKVGQLISLFVSSAVIFMSAILMAPEVYNEVFQFISKKNKIFKYFI